MGVAVSSERGTRVPDSSSLTSLASFLQSASIQPAFSFENLGSHRNGATFSPEMGVFAPPSPFFQNV